MSAPFRSQLIPKSADCGSNLICEVSTFAKVSVMHRLVQEFDPEGAALSKLINSGHGGDNALRYYHPEVVN
jgi:hypothetical protein